jgi:hypothetical protein
MYATDKASGGMKQSPRFMKAGTGVRARREAVKHAIEQVQDFMTYLQIGTGI